MLHVSRFLGRCGGALDFLAGLLRLPLPRGLLRQRRREHQQRRETACERLRFLALSVSLFTLVVCLFV